jgi:hypothetical protein
MMEGVNRIPIIKSEATVGSLQSVQLYVDTMMHVTKKAPRPGRSADNQALNKLMGVLRMRL